MSKVRINDLARELEVKSRPILDALEAIGITGKTHSSSIEADQAEKVRSYFNGGSRTASANRQPAEVKPKFDLSKVSKPGDALKAILERKQADAAAKAAPPRPTAHRTPAASGSKYYCSYAARSPGDCQQAASRSRDRASTSRSCRDDASRRRRGLACRGCAFRCRQARSSCGRRRHTGICPTARSCRRCSDPPCRRSRRSPRGSSRGRRASRAGSTGRPSAAPYHHAADRTAPDLHRATGRSWNPGAQPSYLRAPTASVPRRSRFTPHLHGARRTPPHASDAHLSEWHWRSRRRSRSSWFCSRRCPARLRCSPWFWRASRRPRCGSWSTARPWREAGNAPGGASGIASWQPALREEQRRPDEGLPAAIAFWRSARLA